MIGELELIDVLDEKRKTEDYMDITKQRNMFEDNDNV